MPKLTLQAEVKEAAAVAPTASAVRSANEQVEHNAQRVEVRLDSVTREATSLREGLQSALSEADRLRKAKTATEADLEGMWQRLTSLTSRNLFLESEAQAAQKDLAEQKSLRAAADAKVVEMEAAAIAKDAEAGQLRTQWQDEKNLRAADHDAAESAANQLSLAQTRADKLAGEIRIYRMVAIGAAAILVLLVALKFLLPGLKGNPLAV